MSTVEGLNGLENVEGCLQGVSSHFAGDGGGLSGPDDIHESDEFFVQRIGGGKINGLDVRSRNEAVGSSAVFPDA